MSLWERPPGIRRMVELEYRSIAPNRVMEEACGLDIQQRCRPDQHGIFHLMATDLGFTPKIKMEILRRRVHFHPIRQLVAPVPPVPQEMMTLPLRACQSKALSRTQSLRKTGRSSPQPPRARNSKTYKQAQLPHVHEVQLPMTRPIFSYFLPRMHWLIADGWCIHIACLSCLRESESQVYNLDIWSHIRLFENHLDNFIVYVQSLTHPSPEYPVLRTVAGWLRHSLHSFTCTSFLRTMLTMNHGFSISKLKCWTAEMLIYMQHAVILILWSLCNIWCHVYLKLRIQEAWYGLCFLMLLYFILRTCFFFDAPSSLQRGALNGIAQSNCTKQLMRCARWLLQLVVPHSKRTFALTKQIVDWFPTKSLGDLGCQVFKDDAVSVIASRTSLRCWL